MDAVPPPPPSAPYDGVAFRPAVGEGDSKGDFVSYEPDSFHSSYTNKGCLILTFMRGHNYQVDKKNKI